MLTIASSRAFKLLFFYEDAAKSSNVIKYPSLEFLYAQSVQVSMCHGAPVTDDKILQVAEKLFSADH